MKPPPNEMVMASAGSGKTRELAARFVRLLLLGTPPEKIAALTFTRKAAGEFLERIVALLCEFAQAPGNAASYYDAEDAASVTSDAALTALETLARSLGRLRLGTIDSFFTRMARGFAIELGLPGDFEILQDAALDAARERVLRALLSRNQNIADPLIAAFNDIAHGEARFDVAGEILRLVEEYHDLLLETGGNLQWGDEISIWGNGGCPWNRSANLASLVSRARSHLYLIKEQQPRAEAPLEKSFEEINAYRPGSRFPDNNFGFIVKYLLPLYEKLAAGDAQFEYYKKPIRISGSAAQDFAALLSRIVGEEFQRRLKRAGGVHQFIKEYERIHDAEVRASGGLAFADLAPLLDPLRFDLRPLLDFRLDGMFDHWMLDEFQDTNRAQWRVLQNLIDEVIQSPQPGARSFFAVGDVKQAIYGFRGGDARLFQEILDHYQQGATPRLSSRSISRTYRLAPPIVGLINDLFDPAKLPDALPAAAREEWRRIWFPHESGKPELQGHAAICLFDAKPKSKGRTDDAGGAEDEEALAVDPVTAAVIERLEAVQPWKRGLSCAVLCRTNDQVNDWIESLRAKGIPCTGEGKDSPATDNDIGNAIRCLLRLAAHPGDTAAFEFLRMTPLAGRIGPCAFNASGALRAGFRKSGFHSALRECLSPLRDKLDAFNAGRLDLLLGAAADADASGETDPDAFLRQLEALKSPGFSAPGTVVVMTIHKSKGLEFDMVILPVKKQKKPPLSGGDIHAIRDAKGHPVAVVELPRKEFLAVDPRLGELQEQAEATAASEMLRLLYVAATRSKHELRILVPKSSPGKEEGPILDAEGFLSAALASGSLNEISYGDATWFEREGVSLDPSAETAPATPLPARRPQIDPARLRPRPRRRTPSGAAHDAELSIVDWNRNPDSGVVLGTAVHELFAKVEWIDASNPPSLPELFGPGGGAGPRAMELVQNCLRNSEVAETLFTRPANPHRLLREAAFEWFQPGDQPGEGEWTTGVFDRVIVECDKAGRAIRAVIADFKTDLAPPEAIAQTYAPQLEIYRRALSAIEALDPGKIKLTLVHVRTAKLVPLP